MATIYKCQVHHYYFLYFGIIVSLVYFLFFCFSSCELVHDNRTQCCDLCTILAHVAVKKTLKIKRIGMKKKLLEVLKPCHPTTLYAENTKSSFFYSHLFLWLHLSSEGGRKKSLIALNSPKQRFLVISLNLKYGKLLSPSGADFNFEANIFVGVQTYPL